MANMFLGFPVPRAKIADMISQAAPPALHKTQHQDHGTDELDVTGLIGAGGMADLYADQGLFYNTFHESLENIINDASESAAIEFWEGDLYMYTGSTAGSIAQARKEAAFALPVPNWAKDRKFKTKVEIASATNNVGTVWIVSGNIGIGRHIGFKVVNGVLYGTVANGTEETLTIETLGAGAYSEIRTLEVVFTAGVKAEFFVDGVSKGSITGGNLPTGVNDAYYLYEIYLTNGAGAKNIELTVGRLKLYQAA